MRVGPNGVRPTWASAAGPYDKRRRSAHAGQRRSALLRAQRLVFRLRSLLGGDGQDDVKNQRRQHGAVPSLRSGQALAAAEAHQPGAFVFQIELAERTLNILENSRCHRGEYGGASG